MGPAAIVLVGALMALMSSCFAYDFYVGQRDGWVEQPRESYSSWASKNRFQVHDRLIFKYKQWNDSVLVVTGTAYDTCNVTDPIESYNDGNTIFQFNQSGPFYFISGAAGHCTQGQKLLVVVMAARNNTHHYPPSAPSPSPSPASAPTPSWSPPPQSSSSTSFAVSKASFALMVLLVLGRAFIY